METSIASRITRVLEAESAVAVAYLFGSVAEDRAGPLSDVDVGIVLFPGSEPEAFGRLLDGLVLDLRTEEVDLQELVGAPFPVRYRAIRGKRLMCRDELIRERFEVETVMRYLDFQPLRLRAQQVVRDRILGGE